MVKTTLKIDGMMCGMCEAHVNDTIRKVVPDAQKVKSSHIKGESTFISEQEIDEHEIIDAVAKTGYTVQSVNTEPYTKKLFGFF